MPKITIYNGDANDVLSQLAKNTKEIIDLIITSPPYWNLIDYHEDGQLGFNMAFNTYLAKLQEVLVTCVQLLKKNKMLIINIGDVNDKYAHADNTTTSYMHSISSQITYFLTTKLNLLLFRDITWHKPNYTSPGIKGTNYMGKSYPRNILPYFDTEHILVFIKPDIDKTSYCPCKSLQNNVFDGIEHSTVGQWKSNLWSINKQQDSTIHPAAFPEDIPYRLIRLFSLEGETVLDPFMGRGTTLKMAACLKRNSIGIELNQMYIDNFIKKYISQPVNLHKLEPSCPYQYCNLTIKKNTVSSEHKTYDILPEYINQQKLGL